MKLSEVIQIWDKLPMYEDCLDEDASEDTFTFRDFYNAIDKVIGVENDFFPKGGER